jgi:hypothetical protein
MRFLYFILAFFALASCGGGGAVDGTVAPVDPFDPTYHTIQSTVSETSALTAAGFVLPAAGIDAVDILVPEVNGSVEHDNGSLLLNDGVYAFVGSYVLNDPLDPTGGGYFVDTNGAGFALFEFDGGGFDYVLRYLGNYQSAGIDYVAAGVGGIATEAEYIPSSSTATYNGIALGAGASSSGAFELADGTVQAQVNFGTGRVDLTANGFTASGSPVDEIRVTNATISGNVFSGGDIDLYLGAASANSILGSNETGTLRGGFYGWDATANVPDEVGGVLLQAGEDGYVNLYFAAD